MRSSNLARVVQEADALAIVAAHARQQDVVLLAALERVHQRHLDLVAHRLLERAASRHVRQYVLPLALLRRHHADLRRLYTLAHQRRDNLLRVLRLHDRVEQHRSGRVRPERLPVQRLVAPPFSETW